MWLTPRAINFEHNEYKHLNDNSNFLSLVTFWFRIFYQVKILIWFVVHQVQSMNMYLHRKPCFSCTNCLKLVAWLYIYIYIYNVS
jgi:hypothetical protein